MREGIPEEILREQSPKKSLEFQKALLEKFRKGYPEDSLMASEKEPFSNPRKNPSRIFDRIPEANLEGIYGRNPDELQIQSL